MSFSGGNREYVMSNLPSPFGIAIKGNYMYWVDRNLKKVNCDGVEGFYDQILSLFAWLAHFHFFSRAIRPISTLQLLFLGEMIKEVIEVGWVF